MQWRRYNPRQRRWGFHRYENYSIGYGISLSIIYFFTLNTDVLSVGVILYCIFTPFLKFFSPSCLNLIERLSF